MRSKDEVPRNSLISVALSSPAGYQISAALDPCLQVCENYFCEVAHSYFDFLTEAHVGEQNLPPQNVSLACRLFQAENNQSPRDSGKNFDLLPNCLKEFRQRACSWNRAISRDLCKEYGLSMVGETGQGLEIRVHSVSYCLCVAQRTFVYQTFAFPSSCELPSSSLKSQTTTPNIHLCLQLKMVFKVRALAILASYSVFLGLSHVYTFNFCLIFPLFKKKKNSYK